MGGWNSGRHRTRAEIEDGLVLDLGRLRRLNLVVPGAVTFGSIVWTTTVTKERRASVGYEANLANPDDAWLLLTYRVDGLPQSHRIGFCRTPCRFGGYRWWWTCPRTGRLAHKLYLPPGGKVFCSRLAYRGLAYRSEMGGPMDRTHYRQSSIFDRLGGTYQFFEQGPPLRPKGMHRTTYERFLAKLKAAEAAHERAFTVGGARFLGLDLED